MLIVEAEFCRSLAPAQHRRAALLRAIALLDQASELAGNLEHDYRLFLRIYLELSKCTRRLIRIEKVHHLVERNELYVQKLQRLAEKLNLPIWKTLGKEENEKLELLKQSTQFSS